MVNQIINRMPGSPLGCCNPKEERQMVSPVFRQQYVNDNGKMKLTMPVSPLHYITSPAYYANDYRLAQLQQPWEVQQPNHPQLYDPQMMHTEERKLVEQIYPKQVDSAVTKRIPTPNIHLMMQQRRQASAQLGMAEKGMPEFIQKPVETNNVNMVELLESLRRIEAKLNHLEETCKSNEVGLLKVLRTLLGTDNAVESAQDEMAVPPTALPSLAIKDERLIMRNVAYAQENMRANSSLRRSGSSMVMSKAGSESMRTEKMLTNGDIPQTISEFNAGKGTYGSTVFDVSQELRQSNDMLEKFLSNSSLDGSKDGVLMQQENMELSMLATKQTPAIAAEHMRAINNDKFSKKTNAGAGGTALNVKPLVTTASMATMENRNNRVIEDLEKRFHMMLNTLDNISEARHMSEQKLDHQREDLRAIENDSNMPKEQLSLNAPPAANSDALALLKSGQMALLNSSGEMVPCKLSTTGDEIARMGKCDVAVDDNIASNSMALAQQGEMSVAPLTSQDISKRTFEQYQADITFLKEIAQKGNDVGQECEKTEEAHEYDEPETHKITCSIIPDNESEEGEQLEHMDSIRGLNTTTLD